MVTIMQEDRTVKPTMHIEAEARRWFTWRWLDLWVAAASGINAHPVHSHAQMTSLDSHFLHGGQQLSKMKEDKVLLTQHVFNTNTAHKEPDIRAAEAPDNQTGKQQQQRGVRKPNLLKDRFEILSSQQRGRRSQITGGKELNLPITWTKGGNRKVSTIWNECTKTIMRSTGGTICPTVLTVHGSGCPPGGHHK